MRDMRNDRHKSLLLLVDMQERLLPAVVDSERTLRKAALLATAAERMKIPVLVSEHYPKGIGPTSEGLSCKVSADSVMQKIHFSCFAEDECRRRIVAAAREQVVLGGTETHVCVQQTALDLKQAGYDVFVAADATSSRHETDKNLAIARMQAAGIVIVSAEMAVFEWMGRADTPLFREMLALIKEA
jgi:nicotinamidase-related amidase